MVAMDPQGTQGHRRYPRWRAHHVKGSDGKSDEFEPIWSGDEAEALTLQTLMTERERGIEQVVASNGRAL